MKKSALSTLITLTVKCVRNPSETMASNGLHVAGNSPLFHQKYPKKSVQTKNLTHIEKFSRFQKCPAASTKEKLIYDMEEEIETSYRFEQWPVDLVVKCGSNRVEPERRDISQKQVPKERPLSRPLERIFLLPYSTADYTRLSSWTLISPAKGQLVFTNIQFRILSTFRL